MTVYVDDMYKHPMGQLGRMKMSHMIADTEQELHEMAQKIGMQRRWYQKDHYDISISRRSKAVELGAVEVSMVDLASMCKRQKVEGHCGAPSEAKAWFLEHRRQRRELRQERVEASQ